MRTLNPILASRRGQRILTSIVVAGLFVLAACTDYVGQIDERIEEYDAYAKARSESFIRTAEYYVEPSSVFFGVLEDSRDGQTYRTVTIGSQTWMAENLNYDVPGSYCYDDVDSNCVTYGKLYTWATAMDSVGKWSENGRGCGNGKLCVPTYPVRGICPDGWHLPSEGEWETLRYAVDDFSDDYSGNAYNDMPIQWKIGWDGNSNGEEGYGLLILSGGAKMNSGKYYYEGSRAYFWTSTDDGKTDAGGFSLHLNTISEDWANKKAFALSVRCVKNETDDKSQAISSSVILTSSSSKESEDGGQSSSSVESSDSKTSSSSTDPRETFVDERDGKVYKATVIGKQRWMAENLNFETERSSCYNDSAANCDMYGRLYPWADAVDSAGVYSKSAVGCGYGVECSPPSHVRGICPENWHLPTQEEWKTLFDSVGNKVSRLRTSTGFGFEALSAGYRMSDTTYYYLGSEVRFWSSGESTPKLAYYVFFENDAPKINSVNKYYGFSIRCVQDDEVSGLISSSSAESSSSGKAPWSYLNSKISYGEMTDVRDGQVYKTVEIGDQTWMAENLNYGILIPKDQEMNDDMYIERYCFNDDTANCDLYGGLYQWAEANNLPYNCRQTSCMDTVDGVVQMYRRGICPEGWHLPSNAEFEMLIETLGGEDVAGDMLKSVRGWNVHHEEIIGKNRNSSGFTALPACKHQVSGTCDDIGYCTVYWSMAEDLDVDEHSGGIAYFMSLSYDSDYARVSSTMKNEAYSVRCVKGDVSSAMYSSSSSTEEYSSIGTSSSCESSSSAEASSSSEGYSSSGSSSSEGSSSSSGESSSSSAHSSSSSNSSSSGNGE